MEKYLTIFGILIISLFGCKSNDEATHSEAEADKPKIKLTAYSNDFELFAEADPFVTGDTAEILSHFSHLPSFKALESGSITIRLMAGGKEAVQILEKPTRKGIYKFFLVPQNTGSGKLVFDIQAGDSSYQVVVPDITVYGDEESAHSAAESVIIPYTNTTVFTKEQSWKIEFATEFPQVGDFGQVIKTSARIEASRDGERIIVAKTSGIVSFTGDNLLEGNPVSAGKVLLKVVGSDLSDNNSAVRFAEARNNFEKAESDLNRMERLSADKIVTEKDLIQARNIYSNAKTVYENQKKNFSSAGQTVTSPLNGFVKLVMVQNGQFVREGDPLVTVSQDRQLLIRADLQPKFLGVLDSIKSATLSLQNSDRYYTLKELNGKILAFGRSANTDNYLIPLTLKIDNPGDFIPGGFIELNLVTLEGPGCISVPNEALLEDQGVFFLFIQVNPELFEKRAIKTGATDGIRTAITAGLSTHDRIVTRGAIFVKLAQASGALDAHSGHVH